MVHLDPAPDEVDLGRWISIRSRGLIGRHLQATPCPLGKFRPAIGSIEEGQPGVPGQPGNLLTREYRKRRSPDQQREIVGKSNGAGRSSRNTIELGERLASI